MTTKQDIIEHLTHNCGLRRASAIAAVNGMIGMLARTIANGDDIILLGLGTFRVRTVPQRRWLDLFTNAPVTVP